MLQLLRFTAAAVALAVLAGCASYQFGDISSGLLDHQRDYCSTADPKTRAALLMAIRFKVPGYPASGLCSDAEQALAQEIAERAAELPEGATIDLEQARRDQERFAD